MRAYQKTFIYIYMKERVLMEMGDMKKCLIAVLLCTFIAFSSGCEAETVILDEHAMFEATQGPSGMASPLPTMDTTPLDLQGQEDGINFQGIVRTFKLRGGVVDQREIKLEFFLSEVDDRDWPHKGKICVWLDDQLIQEIEEAAAVFTLRQTDDDACIIEDMDFDSFMDFRIMRDFGTGGVYYYCYLWNEEEEKYERRKSYDEMVGNLSFHAWDGVILGNERDGAAYYVYFTYMVIEGESVPVLKREERFEFNDEYDLVTQTVSAVIDEEWIVIKEWTEERGISD